MSDPIFHSSTQKRLRKLITDLPHAVLLTGPAGCGTYTAAQYLANAAPTITVSPTDKNGAVDPNGSIKIEQIRALYESTRTKQARIHVYILDNADTMNHAAQNAFLKLLEEPAEHVRFILTAHTPQQLLPTIRSRVQTVTMHAITNQQSADFLKTMQINDPRIAQQIAFMAHGLPAELARLCQDTSYFQDRAQIMTDAKLFLQGSAYQKITVVFNYSTDRAKALLLLSSALTILQLTIKNNPTKPLIATGNTLSKAYDRIAANGNIRLQLAAAVVQ